MNKKTRPLLLFLFVLFACSLPNGGGQPEESPAGDGNTPGEATEISPDEITRPTPDPDAPAAELNCETLGLPCTIDQVAPEILARGAELHQELKDRIANGENLTEAQAWLEGLDEVRIVLTNPHGLVFVLEGGVPVGVYDAVAARGLEPAEAADAGLGSGVRARTVPGPGTILLNADLAQGQAPAFQGDSGQSPAVHSPYPAAFVPLELSHAPSASGLSPDFLAVRPPQTPLWDVVGHDTPRENEEHLKRALILSPFAFEFTVPDAGAPVAQILRGIRDYKERVDHLLDDQVGVSAFLGWGSYDVIMYNGHGGIYTGIDKNTGLKVKSTFLMTGDEQFGCGMNTFLQDYAGGEGYPPGVGCMGVSVRYENIAGKARDEYRDYLMVTPQFFSTPYSGGLQKAVILINGCKSFISDALPNRLSGGTSVYFGWTDNVLSNFNPGVMSNLVSKLAKGIPSKQAYEEACGSGGCVDGTGVGASLLRYGVGDDLRIREIATLLHPLSENELDDGDKLLVYGYPADGEKDDLPFYIEVVGVKEEEIADYTIRFEIDGEEVDGAWKLDDPSAVERWEMPAEGTYRILDRLPLPFDFEQYQMFTIEALVDLPEKGKSYSVKTAPLARNPALGITSFVELEDEGTKFTGNVSGEVPLSLVKIDETEVKFESIDQPGGLVYDSADLVITQVSCQVSSQTTDGSMDVLEAIFPAEGFTNTGLPPPKKLVMIPTEAITESFTTVCEGAQTETGVVKFWRAGFSFINEDLLVESEGWVWKNWEPGGGSIYGVFERDKSVEIWDVIYTLEVREPQQ